MPVKVIAPRAWPARITASAKRSDSPEQPATRVRPPRGRADATSCGPRRRGAIRGDRPLLHMLVEIGLSLLLKRAHALLRFLGFVEEFDRAQHRQADAADAFAIGVEG